jgi:hypothetical protein
MEHQDFRYLCARAKEKSCHVELGVTVDGVKNNQGEIVRRDLRSIRVTNRDGGMLVAVPINGNGLDVASRIALRRLSEATA